VKVLVIGSGGREHALVWKLAQSSRVKKIYAAPGNAGTAVIAHNLTISANDIAGLARVVKEQAIDLTVVGPEIPLAAGIVDHFISQGLTIFGPTKAAAEIEWSKIFARDLMLKYGIPCAQGEVFTSYSKAADYIKTHKLPLVIKADGLAAGKGVIIANSVEEALIALSSILEKKTFGNAGDRVLIDQFLKGKEASLLAFSDGKTVVPMVPACDYKRIYDHDLGPNTGGMGGYSPPEFVDHQLVNQIKRTVLEPVVRAMEKEGRPYTGVLYAGLMVTDEGPKVLEFNARFGDPETQVILPRLKSDLVDILLSAACGTLDKQKVEWDEGACVGVVMASMGYPGEYRTGFPISGLNNLKEDVLAFHAGTKMESDGRIYTAGGRVLAVVGQGKTIAQARQKVYDSLPNISFEGCNYRKDIAERALRS
jgi:phosphoribosylamine---glycine ligase